MKRLILLFAAVCAPIQAWAQASAPPEGALKYLQEARAAYKAYETGTEPTMDVARGIIESNAPVFPLLERAVGLPLVYGEGDFERRLGQGRDANGDAPFALDQFVRNAARLLALRSRVQASDGDGDSALGSCLLAIGLGLKMQEDGPMLSSLVGYSIEGVGVQALRRAVPKLSAAQLKRAARRLLAMEAARTPFEKVLGAERAMTLRSMGAALQQGHGPETGFGVERQQAALSVMREAIEAEDALLSRPFALSRGLDFTSRAEEVEHTEEDEEEAPPGVGRFDAQAWAQAMITMLRPTKGRLLLHRTRAQTAMSLLAAALAARAYRIEKKATPASLQALVPDYLPEPPIDPFELNGALQWKAGGEGPVIYSVGPDGLDDGGHAVEGRAVGMESLGDIVVWPEVLKP